MACHTDQWGKASKVNDLSMKAITHMARVNLCLPSCLEKNAFQLAYNELGHAGYVRTHKKLTSNIYIFNMTTKLHEYLRHCPYCQLHQTPRYTLYGFLQPIFSSNRPFHTIIINFILVLLKTAAEEDCCIFVTNKFSKAITLIIDSIK